MDLFSSVAEKHIGILFHLCAPYYGIIATYQPRSFQHICIGQQLHARHQSTAFHVGRHKTAGPCGRVLGNRLPVRHPFSNRITHGHTGPAVRNTAHRIHFHIVLPTHLHPVAKPYFLHIDPFIRRSRESVIYPQE